MSLIRRTASWWNARHDQALYSPSLQKALDERLREIADGRDKLIERSIQLTGALHSMKVVSPSLHDVLCDIDAAPTMNDVWSALMDPQVGRGLSQRVRSECEQWIVDWIQPTPRSHRDGVVEPAVRVLRQLPDDAGLDLGCMTNTKTDAFAIVLKEMAEQSMAAHRVALAAKLDAAPVNLETPKPRQRF